MIRDMSTYHWLHPRWGRQSILGYDPERLLWWWKSSVNSKYYLTSANSGGKPGHSYQIDGGTPVFADGRLHNNVDYFHFSTSRRLWSGGILSSVVGGATREVRLYDDDADAWNWCGDTWWLHTGTGLHGTYNPRGLNKDTRPTLEITLAPVNGWVSDTKLGVYSPSGNAVGSKYVGFRKFKAILGEKELTFFEGFSLNGTSFFSTVSGEKYYMHQRNLFWQFHTGDGWIISQFSPSMSGFWPTTIPASKSYSGFWQKTGLPEIEGTYERVWQGSPEDDPAPGDFTVSLLEYTQQNLNNPSTGSYGYPVSQVVAQVASWL